MKKQKENLFSAKFRLLNSQEHTEEIIWSSSESSEFDECDNKPNLSNITNWKPNRKRKRKVKVSKNVSNLDITIIDSKKDSPTVTSPVLASKTKSKTYNGLHDVTYLIEAIPEANKVINTSPILCTGQARTNLIVKSPVIAQKFASPVNSPKVRKLLFNDNINNLLATNQKKNTSSASSNLSELCKRKINDERVENQIEISTSLQTQNSIEFEEKVERKAESSAKMTKVDVIKKVKSFFDSNFNSESSSQPSIAETLTPKNFSSDDVEILSAISQMDSSEGIVKSIKQTNSTDNSEKEAEKSKKMRYKKDGLAYRLNLLLKKHNANISLWQHERFLAENSNFKIPKGEHLVFRIQKVNFKYRCFLLEAMDPYDEVFSILINNIYVNNCVFQVDTIFKLYEPYQIFNLNNHKLIVNVCKFECVTLDKIVP